MIILCKGTVAPIVARKKTTAIIKLLIKTTAQTAQNEVLKKQIRHGTMVPNQDWGYIDKTAAEIKISLHLTCNET